ncbi:MAG: hypothetical protein ACXV5D_03550 [Halobacteriota archaeon]
MMSSPTPTPSSGSTAASQNVSQYLTTMMQQRNFTVMTAFVLNQARKRELPCTTARRAIKPL